MATAKPKQAKKQKAKAKQKYYLDRSKGNRVIQFIETFCTHVAGDLAGQPLKLAPWQKKDIIIPAFSTLRKSDGLRRYRTVYVEIPRKNGKSALGSAIAAYLTLGDGEPGAQVYCAAADREQARLVFDVAKKMIEGHPRLTAACEVLKNSIFHNLSMSVLKVISAEADTKHGYNAHGVIFDELHVQPNRKLYDVLVTSTGSRAAPVIFIISTAGLVGTFAEIIHDYALGVRDGRIIDETFLPIIYAADKKDNPFSIRTWRKANPGLGTIVKIDYFRQMATRAKNEPSFLNTFLQLHLNIWTGSASAWIGGHDWDNCNFGNTKMEAMAGRPCWGGVDLASVRDLCAFSLFFPEFDGARAELFTWFWCPSDTVAARDLNENVNYSAWVKAGYIFAIPGNANDFDYIADFILNELPPGIELQSIAFDRWNSNSFVIRLIGEGLNMQPYGQVSRSMSAPSKLFEKMILRKEVNHQGNPVLNWQIGNVTLLRDPSGNIKPDKKKSKEKIDGIVSTVMAIGQCEIDNAEPDQKSRYEDEDNKLMFLD